VNILYIENHPVFAESVKRQFLSQHSVTVVATLSAARQALLAAQFDLFLVDYDLDDGKGDEIVRALRATGSRAIIVGVSSHEEGNAALLRAGATAVCSKMHFDQIQSVIERTTETGKNI